MNIPQHSDQPDPSGFTPGQRFEALARRILTTPKAELMKHAPKSKSGKLAGKKKRGK